MITYDPKGDTRFYEVEIREDYGAVVLSVGGMPILYLDPVTRRVHLVPNDVGEEIGLEFDGEGPWVKIERDATR